MQLKRNLLAVLFMFSLLGYAQQTGTYKIRQSDNRWRILKDFQISQDSFLKLNPHLSEDYNSLPVGVTVELPITLENSLSVGDSIFIRKEAPIDQFIIHRVNPKETFYDLVRRYQTPLRDILDYNPGLLLTGLQIGMNLKVRPYRQQSISYKLGFREPLFEPFYSDSKYYTIAYPLPFRTDKSALLDTLLMEKTFEARRDMKFSIHFYQGVLMAIEQLAKHDIHITPIPIDTQLDNTHLAIRFMDLDSLNFDAIIGPLSSRTYKAATSYAMRNDIPIVYPSASENSYDYPKAHMPIPTDSIFRDRVLKLASLRYSNEKVLIVADSLNTKAREAIVNHFPNAVSMELIKEVSVDVDTLSSRLDSIIPNWVFVETQNVKLASSISSMLNSSLRDSVKIKMFTTNYSSAFENDIVDQQQLTNLNFSYPNFYSLLNNEEFSLSYEERFGYYPDRYALRGYDLTLYTALEVLDNSSSYLKRKLPYLTHRLGFVQDSLKGGYYNRSSYILRYEAMDIKLFD
ncbi:MAG: LysM peptidoglycan-binding domain-containing protein [Flavobacteriaceae bacterium]|nr:LysM peptidoglycan-binding domain-containing protein [Flavobacteriaceae bacterium]NVJ71985.1 LysM peptidoglycan-binding domain-containing protein [Flavobacteriaceae bacterium]